MRGLLLQPAALLPPCMCTTYAPLPSPPSFATCSPKPLTQTNTGRCNTPACRSTPQRRSGTRAAHVFFCSVLSAAER